MSHAPSSSTPEVDNDIYAMFRLMQEQMQQQQQQARIQQLEVSNSEQDGKVVYRNPRATTLKLYPELLEAYPAIGETKFFDSELPKNHEVFNWNDFHYTDGMEYKPPPVLQHSEVSLAGPARKQELDLATIQGYLAHTTRFYDTFAHEIVKSGEVSYEQALSFLHTVRISASHDASRISRMRENLYLDELGIKHGNDKEESLFTLDELASKKANADLVRKTYKKYEPPKDKTKKPDKTSKEKSGTDDKAKDKQTTKPQSKDKSGYKSDNSKSGYKSDGGKSGGKPRNKSGSGCRIFALS